MGSQDADNTRHLAAGKNFHEETNRWGAREYNRKIQIMWLDAPRPGSDEAMEAMWAGLRRKVSYRSDGWSAYESRWGQMARLQGTIPSLWNENIVLDAENVMTMPFPGKEQAFDATLFYKQDLCLYKVPQGVSKHRGPVFEDPTYGVPTPCKLDGNYPIVN